MAAMLSSELEMDPVQVRRAALLHDIGKAVTHEVEGSHALIGAEIARRFGEDPAVVHGIEAHHNEVEPGPVRGERLSSRMCADSRSSRTSPWSSTAWSGCSPCRRVVRCG